MSANSFLWLAVNSSSGSYSEAAVADVREAFGSGEGTAPTITRTIDCQHETLPGRSDLEAENVAYLAVFAGDGTLSDYLGKLEREGWGGAVLPLPGGTQNLLCTDMFGDRTAPEIATLFARGELHETRRNCMRCAEHTALAEILAGPGAKWADVREDFREGEVSRMVGKSVEITRDAATGPLVRLVEPPAGRARGYPGLHFSIPDGAIVARGYHMDNLAEWLKQGLAIAMRDFREGPYDELGTMERVRCQSTDGSLVDLMIDGEGETGESLVTITSDRFDLTVLGLPE